LTGGFSAETAGCVSASDFSVATVLEIRNATYAKPNTKTFTTTPIQTVACSPSAGNRRKAVTNVPTTAPAVFIP